MEYVFLGIIIFLFILAIFDLVAGVSNDAANFLTSAIGARAASFRVIVAIAASGILVGALTSNGMIDVVRHGIFRPESFNFYDVICICMAVMVADVVILEVFNTLGMPTSTTVSMVFEILGAAFAVSLLKMARGADLSLGQLLNTDKAFEVIIAIFLSVAVAFVFGTLVQWLARLWFSFDYRRGATLKTAVFGGLCCTGIIYFLLIKGMASMPLMQTVNAWMGGNTWWLVLACLGACTLLMLALHLSRVNVFRVVVLLGTFALAMAFAGNDLVNFIGVPVTGFSSYLDFRASGLTDPGALQMDSLNEPYAIPIYILAVSASIMIISLLVSKKVRKVVDTSVNLTRQNAGEELFGTSRLARSSVRAVLHVSHWVVAHTPQRLKAWSDRQFNASEAIIAEGAAFDLLRGAINLVLAGMLIALGTSWRLPLSTTYVTFMVAMGTSLADRAWGRESAVYRITGVISVIGGWFITAGVAFVGTALIVTVMHVGGMAAIVITALITIGVIIYRNTRRTSQAETDDSHLYQRILASNDGMKAWSMLLDYQKAAQQRFIDFAQDSYRDVCQGFATDNVKLLRRAAANIDERKSLLKITRRKLTLCLRRVDANVAMEANTWFHLSINCMIEITYNLLRAAEMSLEHVDNNFRPLSPDLADSLQGIASDMSQIFDGVRRQIDAPSQLEIIALRRRLDAERMRLSQATHKAQALIREGELREVNTLYVYVNTLQETQEIVANLHKLLRADAKLFLSPDTPIRQ